MMDISEMTIGFAMTGSFCTFKKVIPEIKELVSRGANVIPIMSENAQRFDTRFGKAKDFIQEIEKITNNKIINSIDTAEPIGPKKMLDVIIVAPCTGNTIAKLANSITDTCVTMAVKAHLRNERPAILAISTNDGLGLNAKNIGILVNTKNIYFVPFRQDSPYNKKNSLVAKMDLIIATLEKTMEGEQLQPMILGTDAIKS